MTVAAHLRRVAAEAPDKVAFLYGPTTADGRVTYAQFDAEADRVARALDRIGVQRGDRVAIAMGNVPHFAYAYFGILRAGAVAVPLNAMLSEPEVARVLTDSGARVLIGASPFGDIAAAAAGGVPTVEHSFAVADWNALGPLGDPAPDLEIDDDELAVLAYTSGTTGEPKGAMLTHGNMLANLRQQMEIPDAHVSPDDVLFLALPLFHIFGLNVTLGLLVRNGASGVLLERFEPVAALRAIQDHEVTILFGAPPMYVAWVNTPGADQYDLSKVRFAVSGAAPLPASVLTGFKEILGVDIFEGYGLTETAPTLTSNRMTSTPRAGSIGKPLPGIELRLVDPEGNDVEVGDPGEIIVKGDNVFKGYWQRGDETERAFIKGWFRTGDIAVRDEEGYLYIVDRKRDLVIVSGFNVFPSEVEAALLQHPDIAEAAVIGVSNEYTGEAVKAFVVPEEGVKLTQDEVRAFAQERLARFKCPEFVEFVNELPHLLTGKVLKRALRT
jgi:long-chain acyl-CoA synthetase